MSTEIYWRKPAKTGSGSWCEIPELPGKHVPAIWDTMLENTAASHPFRRVDLFEPQNAGTHFNSTPAFGLKLWNTAACYAPIGLIHHPVQVAAAVDPKAVAPVVIKRELTPDDFANAAKSLGVPVAALRAIAEVEAGGSGFDPDGRPKILFEAHVFDKRTGGKFRDKKDRYGVALSVPKWDRELYGKAGAHQHERLEDAAKLDNVAALESTSWGAFQSMGFNYADAGYSDVVSYVEAMRLSVDTQLASLVGFLRKNKLIEPINKKDWAKVARIYNGPAYATNSYDTKMAAAYKRWDGK